MSHRSLVQVELPQNVKLLKEKLNVNKMRTEFKKLAVNHSNDVSAHVIGSLINDVWEIVRVCSGVIDYGLSLSSVTDSVKLTSLLLILRNMLSDCCCCLDALERGHDRTIFNNIRMVLEDFACVAHAKRDADVLNPFLAGKHNVPKSISFLKVNYPTHEFHVTYGILSKFSHHSREDLVVRQWINRDGLISHLKPFDPKRIQGKLNALMMIMHLARMAGEEAESLCFDELDQSYFWFNQKTRKTNIPLDEILVRVADKVESLMKENESLSPVGESIIIGAEE